MKPGMLTLRRVQVSCATLMTVVLACAWLNWSLWSSLYSIRARMNGLTTHAAPVAPAAPSPAVDFTSHWPVGRVDDVVLDHALRDAQRLGVRVLAATASLHPDSRELVQQLQFSFEVRGTYANVKNWLTEVTARQSGPIIEMLEMRRVEAGTAPGPQQEVVAAARMRLFMRPKAVR